MIKKLQILKALKDSTDIVVVVIMERIVYGIINKSINDCKLCYTDNTEIESVKCELFNSGKYYEIDRTLIYDKLGAIFEYAERYNMNDTVIENIKQENYSDLFSMYALSVFDEYVIDIIKDKYKYDREFITDRYTEVKELTINEIIELYKADTIKDDLIKWVNEWRHAEYLATDTELKWGLVMRIINGIDRVEY